MVTNASEPIIINFTNSSGVNSNTVSTATVTVTADNSSTPLSGRITYISESTYQLWHNENLTPGTKYIVKIEGVKDKNNGWTIPTAKFMFTASTITASNIIFVTHGNWDGVDIDGIPGADQKCSNEAIKYDLPSGIYKAMILSEEEQARYDHFKRTSVSGEPWVLKPNTAYYNVNSVLIGTTNSLRVFDKDLLDYIYDVDGLTTYERVWTGMKSDWTPAQDQTCGSWQSYYYKDKGRYGTSQSKLIAQLIDNGSSYCTDEEDNNPDKDKKASAGHLYCVRQAP